MSHKHRHKPEKPAGLSWGSFRHEWGKWYANKSPVFKFGLKFALLMAVFYGLMTLPICDRMLYAYLEGNAWLSGIILNGLGQGSHVDGVIISSPRFVMAIRRGCDAVEPTWLFCAAILAFPAPWRHKALGMLAGILVLQLLNLIRIITLYFIGIHFRGFFEAAHLEVWPTIFILAAILLWVGWMKGSNRHAPA